MPTIIRMTPTVVMSTPETSALTAHARTAPTAMRRMLRLMPMSLLSLDAGSRWCTGAGGNTRRPRRQKPERTCTSSVQPPAGEAVGVSQICATSEMPTIESVRAIGRIRLEHQSEAIPPQPSRYPEQHVKRSAVDEEQSVEVEREPRIAVAGDRGEPLLDLVRIREIELACHLDDDEARIVGRTLLEFVRRHHGLLARWNGSIVRFANPIARK